MTPHFEHVVSEHLRAPDEACWAEGERGEVSRWLTMLSGVAMEARGGTRNLAGEEVGRNNEGELSGELRADLSGAGLGLGFLARFESEEECSAFTPSDWLRALPWLLCVRVDFLSLSWDGGSHVSMGTVSEGVTFRGDDDDSDGFSLVGEVGVLGLGLVDIFGEACGDEGGEDRGEASTRWMTVRMRRAQASQQSRSLICVMVDSGKAA